MGTQQIKHRFTGAVLFECDAPEDKSGMAVRYALEKATASGANLYGANLYGADLYGANLSGANLSGAKIDGEEITIPPVSIGGLKWLALITDNYLRIGCQRHTHAEWAGFDDEQIEDMSGGAPEFWAQWKAPLLAMCAAHASKVTPVTAREAA